ncbi:hypothetical protein SOVF_024750, partial [Spinacia oleracea]
MENSDHNNKEDHHSYSNSYSSNSTPEENQGLLFQSNKVNIIKVGSFDDDHGDGDEARVIDGDDEGFKTPTKREHRIAVDIRCPPPAPKKPKAQLMKRRRPSCRNLFHVTPEDIELLFPPHSVAVRERDTLLNIGSSIDPAAKVNNNNKPNYTTTSLMSL